MSPVCRLITRPRWFLRHWEEVKQSATHTQPLCGDNRLQTNHQMLRSEGPAKTNHYDTLHSFSYSTAPCHGPSQSLVPQAKLRTEKTNLRAVKPQTSPSWFCRAPRQRHHPPPFYHHMKSLVWLDHLALQPIVTLWFLIPVGQTHTYRRRQSQIWREMYILIHLHVQNAHHTHKGQRGPN